MGGLHDPDTQLIRFGWRDYDPSVGRFTAPDPARDMRGDGDLYDYCADDPVSRTDVTGLTWDESKHPRDDIGRFAEAGGGSEAGQTSAGSATKKIQDSSSVDTTAHSKDETSTSGAVLPQPVQDAARLLERPLDFTGGKVLQSMGLPHKQFVFDSGDNFGKMSDGSIRADTPQNMGKYTQKDSRVFNGKYIREAQQELEDERFAVEKMYEDIKQFPLSENMPHEIPEYNVFIDNCIIYAKKVINRAKEIEEKDKK